MSEPSSLASSAHLGLTRSRAVVVLMALCACASPTRGDGGTFGSSSTEGTSTDAASSDGGLTDDGSSDTAGTGAVKYDVGDGASSGGDGEKGCEKVDFLFVIDSSGSMGNNQKNLVDSFPGFISAIQTQIKGQDHHIMVVDTDAEDICDGVCSGGASFCALGGLNCGNVPMLSGCDVELGAGDIRDTDKALCDVAGGIRYMTQAQNDLAGTFACIATTGTYGDGNEQPIGATIAALSDGMNNGGCNDGFLRDDAVLVLTVITDAPPDTASEQVHGDAMAWRDAVVAAKNGYEKHITVLGLVSDGDLPGGLCSGMPDDSAKGSPKMREFVGMFTHNVLASVCEPSYASFFAQAVQVVDTACNDFVPEG